MEVAQDSSSVQNPLQKFLKSIACGNEMETIWHKTKNDVLGSVFSTKENAHKVSVSKTLGNTLIVISEVQGC